MADTDPNPTVPSWEPRVAVLEQIARDTAATLVALREDIRHALDRIERRVDMLDRRQHANFLWLVSLEIGGFAALLGVMAHGFHWI